MPTKSSPLIGNGGGGNDFDLVSSVLPSIAGLVSLLEFGLALL